MFVLLEVAFVNFLLNRYRGLYNDEWHTAATTRTLAKGGVARPYYL